MIELTQKAKSLLESNTVQVVIGYGKGSADKTRAVFLTNPEDCDQLIFDSRCVQNLAVYLTKPEIKKMGKPAIVAPIPVLRSIVQLAGENQLKDENLVVLGVSPEGKYVDFETLASIETYLSDKEIALAEKYRKTIDEIKAKPVAERFEYWVKELESCFKCYACRAACPLCYCTRCTVENNQPAMDFGRFASAWKPRMACDARDALGWPLHRLRGMFQCVSDGHSYSFAHKKYASGCERKLRKLRAFAPQRQYAVEF